MTACKVCTPNLQAIRITYLPPSCCTNASGVQCIRKLTILQKATNMDVGRMWICSLHRQLILLLDSRSICTVCLREYQYLKHAAVLRVACRHCLYIVGPKLCNSELLSFGPFCLIFHTSLKSCTVTLHAHDIKHIADSSTVSALHRSSHCLPLPPRHATYD